ncbi:MULTISPECIES: TspO/MBR family protein [Thalassobaculum]|uniref:TspO and MBR related proteins n=1 Tax=Thalassobaculum litoreum DSM 18839 TaxID=1123362 RepID=A0A8G2BEY3_9PROT|nr:MULTISPECIES: TspO/MBR family protein [Thalassobaculum]SDF26940.1 TspO and MBR related proteins [Thalassobaculum litoreum DSM 18839]
MFDPALIVFIVACTAAALTGVLFKPGQWYEQLAKPWWRPPNWLFGPAWTILYAMIAISGWLVWKASSWPAMAPALTIYGVQLLLNAGWSPLFFGLRRPDLAFYELLLLWTSILATIIAFLPISPLAAGLLVPYLAWVTFAGALNLSIVRLNPVEARG